MRNLGYKFYVISMAPLELMLCTAIGAWKGFRLGLENIRDIWEQQHDPR